MNHHGVASYDSRNNFQTIFQWNFSLLTVNRNCAKILLPRCHVFALHANICVYFNRTKCKNHYNGQCRFHGEVFFYCSQFCWVFPPNHLFNSIYKVNLYKCEFKQRSIKLNCCNGEHKHTRKILWLLTEIALNCDDRRGYWKGKYEKSERDEWK